MDKLNTVKNTVDQLLGQGNFDIVDSVFSVNYVAHSGDKSYNGHKFIKQFAKQVRQPFPILKF